MEIHVTDPDALEASRQAWARSGLPALPSTEARFVAAVIKGDGRLAAYWVAESGGHVVLWTFDPRDRLGVGHPMFPAAWGEPGAPLGRAAAELLEAHWLMLGTYRRVPGPELVIEEGLLDVRRLGLLAARVWVPSASRPRRSPGDVRAQLELAAARLAIEAGPAGIHIPEAPLVADVHAFPHLRWCGDAPWGVYAASLVVGRIAGWRLLAVRRRTMDGDSCLVYGLAREDRHVPELLRRAFEANGHPATPFFPSLPTAVVHAGNAPEGWPVPNLGPDEARDLLWHAVPSIPAAAEKVADRERFDRWFELITEAEHVEERCRRLRADGIQP